MLLITNFAISLRFLHHNISAGTHHDFLHTGTDSFLITSVQTVVKDLGAIIDHKFTFSYHIEYMLLSCSETSWFDYALVHKFLWCSIVYSASQGINADHLEILHDILEPFVYHSHQENRNHADTFLLEI